MSTKRVIDISKWNVVTDFAKISKDVDGVIIRMGYRGNTSGGLIYDKEFVNNINGLSACNVPVGVYWFTNAINAQEGVEEADFVIETIKKLKLNLSFPVMIDTEYGNDKHTGRADNIDNESRTDAVIAFLERIMEAGYQSAIYASNSWFKDQLNYNRIKKYPKWVAKYSDTAPTVRDNLIGWQKSSHGSCNGINGRVDINDWYIHIGKESFYLNTNTEVKEPIKETQTTTNSAPTKEEPKKEIEISDGLKITLKNASLYSNSNTSKVAATKSGTFYIWNKSIKNGRIRITTKESYVKQLGKVTAWINVSDIL